MYGPSTAEEVVSGLEALKAQRDLDSDEARKLDDLRMSLARVDAMQASWPEYSAALLRGIPAANRIGERPAEPQSVAPLRQHPVECHRLCRPPDQCRRKSRSDPAPARHTQGVVPTAYNLWNDLAQITLQQGDLDSIARAEPYFHNAIHYSVYGNQQLSNAVRPKWMRVLDQSNIMKAVDISGLTPEQLAELDAIINCPLAMQLSVLRLVCDNDGTPETNAPMAMPQTR